MTVTKHEILTVRSPMDPVSISEAILEIPSDAELTDAEVDTAGEPWQRATVMFTFRREVTNE